MISILSVNADAGDLELNNNNVFEEQPEVRLRYHWGKGISLLCFIFSFITCHSIRTFER